MSGMLASIFLAIPLGWCLAWIFGWAIDARRAVGLGLGLSLVLCLGASTLPPISFLMALLDPIGLIIPVLALRSMARAFGWRPTPFARWEIAVFLAAYLLFLLLSIGVGPFDPYRLGYDPLWAGLTAVVFILFGALRCNILLPAVAVTAQVMWLSDVASSNYFDHIAHAVLLPVLLVALIRPGQNRHIPRS